MQLICIRDFSQFVPGDLVEVPDGAAFDDFHWQAAPPGNCGAIITEFAADPQPEPEPELDPEPPAAAAPQFPQPAPKEM